MPSYSTPGVYIEEIAVFPPSVAPVATAIPVFIGCTDKATGRRGESLLQKAVRLTSLIEFEGFFGKAALQDVSINVTKRLGADGALLGVDVTWKDGKPPAPTYLLYPSLQLYFANGGGPCYVFSLGDYKKTPKAEDFTNAIKALEAVDEPTLLVFPDATLLTADYGAIVDAALTSCNKTQDRFTLADVPNAIQGGNDSVETVNTNFRAKVSKNAVDFTKYGAAYYPYLHTSLRVNTDDAKVNIASFTTGIITDGNPQVLTDKKLSDTALDLGNKDVNVYAAIKSFLDEGFITLPPSGAIAGVYAQVDRTRGVWKAPANVGLSLVIGPAVNVTNDMQDRLNIDSDTGKSVNAIRAFFGKGTMVWGARTLAGNDNEWRYVNVRRFASFVEESVKKAISAYLFEPNNANTWVKARTMIENFLINQWRDGALVGAKSEHAFKVAVGLGQTMSAQDIFEGYMIVEVHLAIVRPAEFIVLRFMQKMPQS